MSIYDANVYSTLENNINQFKYLYKNSISTKCFGDLPISVSHPRFFLQVYSLWFAKHCPKKDEKKKKTELKGVLVEFGSQVPFLSV